MPKSLRKIFASVASKVSKNSSSGAPLPELATLKKLAVPPRCVPSRSPTTTGAAAKPAKASPTVSSQVLARLKEAASKNSKASLPSEDSAVEISRAISSILHGNNDAAGQSSAEPMLKKILDLPWFSNMSHAGTAQWRKDVSRGRKQKYKFKNTESYHFTKLMRMCASKLGTESTLEFFGKLGRETGIKEYNALIKLCIGRARYSAEEDSLVQIHRAYQLFLSMRERGFQIDEESYAPFLMYLIDMKMTQEFEHFSKFFKDENPGSCFRIGYFEMLLWIRVGDEDKIWELCSSLGIGRNEENYSLAESYLLAFCESDRKEELLKLLEVLDISKISSFNHVATIFKSLGRTQLQKFAEKFILELKTTGAGEENISSFIYDYATSIPNLPVEDTISEFNNLHQKLEVIPSTASFDKLITLCCKLSKVDAALDVADRMCQSCSNVSIESFHPILHACEQCCEPNMVHPIYLVMWRHNLKPKGDTFKSMISLCMKLKDFEGAYNLLTDAEEMNEMPTAGMYNAIMAGYFRQKNNCGALMVLKQMEDANIKPDSETFSYLISNCESEKDIGKYREEMQRAGLQVTKHVYMALINAYANFGNFKMAKEIALDRDIPNKFLNEIKSVLVSALSSNGQISDALRIYDEIKQAGCSLEPKAVISLIEHLRTEGELDRLLQLLEELNDSSSWFDGCSRIALYCIQYNIADAAVKLLKQLQKKDESSTYIVIDQIFSQIWETESTNLNIGLELLRAVKEELDLHPSRTSLDFLLSTCAKVKDSQHAWFIWSEYSNAGLPYNVLTFLRMYQALLASGECKAAKKMLKEIEEEDPHVRSIIKSCKMKYRRTISENEDRN
ncbi:pentatricopeptide repeat-containing protein At4g21880, mitochondrial isoform X2 [Elaeis guineensis]|uniref:Pentatricopeptide repeat-containing protein At4g04790, mitochondrial isoform X2 n=1 Tax=Elaeis guineensis var. tenera TaxID=51953 RepID=A0A6I9QBA7_ELAGV|nr:pentatricopeptide repeat-containing protein At4g04790, mitochondrial isoform X2 [Elaeis guineensis]